VGIPPAPRGIPRLRSPRHRRQRHNARVAKDLGTGKEQRITITASTKLAEDQIKRMVKDAEKYSERTRSASTRPRPGMPLTRSSTRSRRPSTSWEASWTASQKEDTQKKLEKLKEELKGKDVEKIRPQPTTSARQARSCSPKSTRRRRRSTSRRRVGRSRPRAAARIRMRTSWTPTIRWTIKRSDMGLFDSVFGRKEGTSAAGDVERRLKTESQANASEVCGEFKVDEVFKITGVGVVPVGVVLSGFLEPGFRCENQGKTYEIKTIEMHHEQLNTAVQGDKVG